ncbi:hypothetical protein JW859_06325 [bacterium]|nr:hypothetical protein [bacterium]
MQIAAAVWANRLISLVLDALAVAGLLWGLPAIATQLNSRGWLTGALVLAAYLAMCGGLLLLKLVRPIPPPEAKPAEQPAGADQTASRPGELAAGWALGLSLPFAAFVLVMLVDAAGVLTNEDGWLTRLNTGPAMDTVLSVAGILLFILVFGLFPWVLLYQPRPRHGLLSPAGLACRTAGLLGANVMILATAAYWQAQLADSEPMNMALGGRILLCIVVYPLFLAFYAPPRLALIGVDGDKWSLWGYLIALAVMIWPLTA